MAEWSKAPDSSSGPRERAWVQIPLLTDCCFASFILSIFLEQVVHYYFSPTRAQPNQRK
ncbi:unnamed protein product [Coffea canephora]|uniref:Uncharacterized protein n=1 Tax=Coffea canephora TaxID=49390 RepID=A0A068TN68_COFCA|nr:unnamed protein product [Coffea canephora]